MARRPWKIDERGAPSPRAYLQAVNRWSRAVRAKILRALVSEMADAEEEEVLSPLSLADRIRRRLAAMTIPAPPSPDELLRVGEPAMRQTLRKERALLIQLGISRPELAQRLQLDEALVVGVDIAPTASERAVLAEWSREGTTLIRTVGQDLVEGLDVAVVEAARAGTLTKDLRDIVEDRLGVSQRHAQFIARDQIAKLNGKVTEASHRAAGITHYVWKASYDARTRPDHRALHNTRQSWSAPPIVDERTGRREHPGGDYQCRCTAYPDITGAR